jgi:hypothetical protein
MTPIVLRQPELAYNTAWTINRLGRTIGRTLKTHVIQTGSRRGTVFELHYPEVERGEVLAILRLLLSGYRREEITPIMVSREREQPRLGARPA